MNGRTINPHRSPRSLAVISMLAAVVGFLAIQPLANGTGSPYVDADEPPVAQIRFDRSSADLPPGVSLVVVGGRLINNSFPAVSADGAEIAILYKAGHPEVPGYPTFEIHSTATLALQERIELLPEAEAGQGQNLREERALMRIEGLLDDINGRLSRGGFHPMDTLFRLEGYTLDGVEKFGKRVDYPSNEAGRALSITSLSTGHVELEMEMPTGVAAYGPEGRCAWGGNPRQGWYDPDLQILILQITFSTSIYGCEQPERWLLKRL